MNSGVAIEESFDMVSVLEMMDGNLDSDGNLHLTGATVPLELRPLQLAMSSNVAEQVDSGDESVEVIALSPETIIAPTKFSCEVCDKSFTRFQNLQLHRKGHGLAWEEKNPAKKRRVYVCPEKGCPLHRPSRGLKELTAIKKHYCRKHGEKKWKCEKCFRTYAVMTDWKMHSKICKATPIKEKSKASGSTSRLQDSGSLLNNRYSEKSPIFLSSSARLSVNSEKLALINSFGPGIGYNYPFPRLYAGSFALNRIQINPLSYPVNNNLSSNAVPGPFALNDHNFLQAVDNTLKCQASYAEYINRVNSASSLMNQNSSNHIISPFGGPFMIPTTTYATKDFLGLGQSSSQAIRTESMSNFQVHASDLNLAHNSQANQFILGRNGLINDPAARDFIGLQPLCAGEESDESPGEDAH